VVRNKDRYGNRVRCSVAVDLTLRESGVFSGRSIPYVVWPVLGRKVALGGRGGGTMTTVGHLFIQSICIRTAGKTNLSLLGEVV